jgi:hypothetical protein
VKIIRSTVLTHNLSNRIFFDYFAHPKVEAGKIMGYLKWLAQTFFNMQFFTTCVLCLTLGLTLATLVGYQSQPDQKSPSGYSDSSGVR